MAMYESADAPETVATTQRGKRKRQQEGDDTTWRLADKVERTEDLHYSVLRQDTEHKHGQVTTLPLQLAVPCLCCISYLACS